MREKRSAFNHYKAGRALSAKRLLYNVGGSVINRYPSAILIFERIQLNGWLLKNGDKKPWAYYCI